MNLEAAGFFNMKRASFELDSFMNIVNLVVHCPYLVEPFLCDGRGEFVLVV